MATWAARACYGCHEAGELLAQLLGKGKLRLDEDHQGFGQHAVIRHRVGHRLGLHRSHDGIHVGNVHEYRHPGRVLRVDERPDVGDPEGPEDLFALRLGKPVILVLHIVVGDYGRHGAPSGSRASGYSLARRPCTQVPHACIDKVLRVGSNLGAVHAEQGSTGWLLNTCIILILC